MAADDSINLTSSFGRLFAQARISCPSCGHAILVDQTMLNLLFPMPIPLTDAMAKLKCSECGHKGADMGIIRKAAR